MASADVLSVPLHNSSPKIKLRLLQSGIKVNQDIDNYLVINAQPVRVGDRVVGYAVSVGADRWVSIEANGKTYLGIATVWSKGGITPASGLRQTINELMDQFLLAYLKANPKKKEK